MKIIDRNQVERMIKTDPDVILVEVLDEGEYMKGHLPEAVNVPLAHDFEDRVEESISNRKKRPIIFYGRNWDCPASAEAAERLEKIGYTNVFRYSGGKDDWAGAGNPMIVPQQ